jgi:hypothetical protein
MLGEKMKTNIKWVIAVCAVMLAFGVGWMWREGIEFGTRLNYTVASDSTVRGYIESRLGNVPKEASRLYYARVGFQDSKIFVAFSAPKSVCESIVQKHFEATLSDLPLTNGVPDWFLNNGPNRWIPVALTQNWDISTNGEYQILEHDNATILYSPKAERLYICWQ